MEEILASIRRIISEDDDGGAKAPAPVLELTKPVPPAPEPEPEFEAEVAFDVPVEPEPEPVRAVAHAPDPIADTAFDIDDEIEFAERQVTAEPEPAPPQLKPRLDPVPDDEALIGAPAAAIAADAFARLSQSIAIADTPNQTIEGLVREMMKPLLRAWLDEHLPRIVEEKVEQEVARLARRMR